MTWELRSMLPTWAVALVGAVVVGILAGSAYLTWIPVVMAGAILVALAIQLPIGRREGLVNRLAYSVAGAAVILAVATGVLALAVPAGAHFAA